MARRKKFCNLFIKLKKTKPVFRFLFILILTIYLISSSLLIYNLILLVGIETLLRILLILIIITYLLFYLLYGLVLLIQKKHIKLNILIFFTILFAILNVFTYYYINKTYNIVDDLSKEKIIYTTKFIKINDTTEIKKVGMLNNEKDIEGYVLPQEYIAINDLKYSLLYFDDNYLLLDALNKKEIDAAFIESNYEIKYNDENYSPIVNKTTIIDTYSKKMDNQDTVESSNKSITEPFTMLLLGVDSEYDGLDKNAAFNGDTIMLVTFNPKTLSATMFSIPRDTYVPIACNHNKSYKINSAAGYGTKCMMDTISNLTGIDIDYYVKINFKGVVSLVESLGGITMDIDEPDFNHNLKIPCGEHIVCEQNSNRQFGNNIVYVPAGKEINLNGEQALAYARNRHQWSLSDFKRIEHQQAVVNAIVNKTKTVRDLGTFYKILNAVTNNIDTNMSRKEILNFYNVFKVILTKNSFDGNGFINIQKTYLTGYDLTLFLNNKDTYTFQYYEESLNEIVTAMKENLELEKPKDIKTFSFSVNEEYVVPIIGKKFSSARKNEVLPNFVNTSLNYVNEWTKTRNINVIPEYIESNDCINDNILEQSVHKGTLVSSVSSLNVKVCKNLITTPTNEQIDIKRTITNFEENETY